MCLQPSLATLQQHDPEAAEGLQAVLQLPQQQYQQLLEVEGRPGSTTRQQYIDLALQQLLVEDVAWQLEALQQGFFTVLDRQVGAWVAAALQPGRLGCSINGTAVHLAVVCIDGKYEAVLAAAKCCLRHGTACARAETTLWYAGAACCRFCWTAASTAQA
jgi:hypothetical protein